MLNYQYIRNHRQTNARTIIAQNNASQQYMRRHASALGLIHWGNELFIVKSGCCSERVQQATLNRWCGVCNQE